MQCTCLIIIVVFILYTFTDYSGTTRPIHGIFFIWKKIFLYIIFVKKYEHLNFSFLKFSSCGIFHFVVIFKVDLYFFFTLYFNKINLANVSK